MALVALAAAPVAHDIAADAAAPCPHDAHSVGVVSDGGGASESTATSHAMCCAFTAAMLIDTGHPPARGDQPSAITASGTELPAAFITGALERPPRALHL